MINLILNYILIIYPSLKKINVKTCTTIIIFLKKGPFLGGKSFKCISMQHWNSLPIKLRMISSHPISNPICFDPISSDPLSNLDNKHGSVLELLYLSAALDTINHCILIKRLHEIGITDMALSWLTSFITRRTTYIENHSSPASTPVLRPIIIYMYIIPLLTSLIDAFIDL